jgi:hypothetical protein
MPDLPDPILWRVASGFHDWMDGALLRSLIGQWFEEGLIGNPDCMETGDKDKPWSVNAGETTADAILRTPRNPAGGIDVMMRGETPHPWWMSVVISAFQPELGRPRGYSMINLNLPRQVCEGNVSGRLLDLFEGLHRPDTCEYASIHPKRHSENLKLRAYVPALTIAPMFAGVLWANFLGPGTVEEFKPEAIDALPVARRRWFDRRGVFFAVSEDLASADKPACEAELVAMTEQLRAGLVAP